MPPASAAPAAATGRPRGDDAVRTRAWQVLHLMDLGFDPADADAIMDEATSWHEPAELLERGATPEQVKRILA